MDFLRESHNQALQEEERRYRFLVEKHCGLIESFTKLMNKVYNLLQIAFVSLIFIAHFGLLTGDASQMKFTNECQRNIR